jgi:hypothetical protein
MALCPPFFLLRGYPSGAKLVLGPLWDSPFGCAASEGDSVRGSPCGGPARLRTGLQGSIPSDPGIRGPLHPPRHRSPPSPYHRGYASVGRLAGGGASTLSVHGLFGNGALETGLTVPPVLSTAGVPQGA